MIIKLSLKTGLFTDQIARNYSIVSLGYEVTKVTHNWVTDNTIMLSKIVGENDEDLKIVGDITFGALKGDLHALFMSGRAWTAYDQALYNIDAKIRENRDLQDMLIKDEPIYTGLGYFINFDCRLIINGISYQATNVFKVGCDLYNPGDIIVQWNTERKPLKRLTPHRPEE